VRCWVGVIGRGNAHFGGGPIQLRTAADITDQL